jgi:hypothetical protein
MSLKDAPQIINAWIFEESDEDYLEETVGGSLLTDICDEQHKSPEPSVTYYTSKEYVKSKNRSEEHPAYMLVEMKWQDHSRWFTINLIKYYATVDDIPCDWYEVF